MTPYPTIHKIKYPKSGDTNWKLRLCILNLETGQTTWLKLGPETDVYYPRFKWTRDPSVVAIERLNRDQNMLDLIFANVDTGDYQVVLTETDPFWVRVDDDLTFFKNSDHFIWTSQRSGYNHAYLYDYNGCLINQITNGNWEINAARSRYAILGVDESDDWLYFEGKQDGVIEQHVYRVKLDGNEIQRLSTKSGWHAALLSPDTKHFIKTFSDVNTPPQISIHRSDGTFIRWIKKDGIPELANFDIANPDFIKVQTSDGLELNAVMLKPVDFNPEKKYPIIFYAYGGISSQTVVNRWGGARWLWHQFMTQKGYIVFTIDNRGTGGRGKAFENYMYQNLGTVPLFDQIEGTKYLASLPYVDSKLIGIWGRSAGGYLTCLALTEGSDYFKVGVAHASVTNYRFYSSVWAERYMGLPQNNQSAYDKEAVV
jgi:dipeptidyl-peptidase-4